MTTSRIQVRRSARPLERRVCAALGGAAIAVSGARAGAAQKPTPPASLIDSRTRFRADTPPLHNPPPLP